MKLYGWSTIIDPILQGPGKNKMKTLKIYGYASSCQVRNKQNAYPNEHACKRGCCHATGHGTLSGLCGREEVLVTLAAVSDFSYAWGLLEPYTAALQAQVDLLALDHTLHCASLRLHFHQKPNLKSPCLAAADAPPGGRLFA